MNDYIFFTDATSDLKPALAREMDAVVLPVPFTLDGTSYFGYADNREMEPEDFYARLRSGARCTTAHIDTETYIDAFTPYLEQGKDILYICFSGSLSHSYQNSLSAAQTLMQQYPGRQIQCVDTLQASLGEGLAAYTAAMLRKEGQSLQEVAAWMRENRGRFCGWFTVDDLSYLQRGGRLSGGAALAGNLFGVKPVLHMDAEGKIVQTDKVRGRRASLDALAERYAQTALFAEHYTVFIGHGDCVDDANYLANRIAEIGARRIEVGMIGPAIGGHSGPGTVALFFHGAER